MHLDDVLAALRRQPFVPFRLHVADGAAYDIRHPELLWVTTQAAFVGLPAEPPNLVPDRAMVIAMGHVSRLEELPAAPAPGNGQQGG
jgi:hypothetical protein